MSFNVAIMGTSLCTGVMSRGWSQELQKKLQIGKSKTVRLHSLGWPAETSSFGLAHVSSITRLRPDVAFIEWINDAYAYYQENPPWNMNLELSAENFSGVVDAIKAGSPSTQIYFMTIVRLTDAARAMSYPNLEAYDAQVRSIATDKNVGMLDLRAVWGDPAQHPSEYPEDGVHCYLAGHERVTIPNIYSLVSGMIA